MANFQTRVKYRLNLFFISEVNIAYYTQLLPKAKDSSLAYYFLCEVTGYDITNSLFGNQDAD